MNIRFVLLLVHVVSYCLTANSQTKLTYPIYSPDLEELSSIQCYSIEIDSNHVKWLGTSNGIYKYDNYDLVRLNNVPRGEILKSITDSQGEIWFGYSNGTVLRYNPYTDESQEFIHILPSYVNHMSEVDGGINVFSQAGKIQRFELNNSESREISESSIYQDLSHVFFENKEWVCTKRNVVNRSNTKSYELMDPENYEKKDRIDSGCFENDSILVYNSGKDVKKLNVNNGEVDDWILLPEQLDWRVIFMRKHTDEIMYIGTYSGLYEVFLKTGIYTKLIDVACVTDVRFSSENNLWCSTLNKGIVMIRKSEARTITQSVGIETSAISIFGDWLIYGGKSSDVRFFNTSTMETKQFSFEQSRKEFNKIVSVSMNENGCAIASTADLVLFDKDGKVKYKSSSAPKSVKLIGEELYYASMHSLHKIGKEHQQELLGFVNGIKEIIDVNNEQIVSWTREQIVQFDMKDASIDTLYSIRGNNVRVLDAIPWKESFYLILLDNDTLVLFNKRSKDHEMIPLQYSGIKRIAASNDRLILGSNHRIFIYSTKNNSLTLRKSFQRMDGFYATNLNELVCNDSYIFAATDNGIFALPFDSEKAKKGKSFFRLVIESQYSPKSTRGSENEISLRYDNSYLSLRLKVPEFYLSQDLEYRCIAQGALEFDQRLTKNVFEFVKFPEGRTTLTFQAFYNGKPVSEIKSVTVDVSGPFWKHPFVIGGSCVLMALIAVGIILFRRKRIKLELKIEQERLRALRNQMNPHFLFNSMNSIQYFIINNKPKEALNYLTSFSRLIRTVLDQSDTEFHSISEEIRFLNDYLGLEQIRLRMKFEYTISQSHEGNLDHIQIPVLVLQPFVENAIWHGVSKLPSEQKGNIDIHLGVEDKVLNCKIVDNGVGTDTKALNESYGNHGIKKTMERISMLSTSSSVHGPVVQFETNETGGVTVHLSLRLKT